RSSALSTTDPTVSKASISRSRGRRTASRRPSPTPASTGGARSGSDVSGAAWSLATSNAATTARPAHTANTLPTPATEISTPDNPPPRDHPRRPHPGGLKPPHDPVGRGQLIRSGSHRGDKRRLCRAGRGHRRSSDYGSRIRRQRHAPRDRRDGGSHRRRLHQV